MNDVKEILQNITIKYREYNTNVLAPSQLCT